MFMAEMAIQERLYEIKNRAADRADRASRGSADALQARRFPGVKAETFRRITGDAPSRARGGFLLRGHAV